jgi:hypothetical protein
VALAGTGISDPDAAAKMLCLSAGNGPTDSRIASPAFWRRTSVANARQPSQCSTWWRGRPRRTRNGNPYLPAALIKSAQAATRSKDTYLRARYDRSKSCHGHNKTIVAVQSRKAVGS